LTEPLWVVVKEPAARENEAEEAPAAIVTEAGAIKRLFVVDTTTVAAPGAAFLVNDTVQVLELFGLMLAGLQVIPEIKAGASRLMSVFTELPP
jgi:hypothetical protein